MFRGLAEVPVWPILLTVGYPILAVLLFEAARRMSARNAVTANILRQIIYVVLPTGTIWLVLRHVALLPPDNLGVRIAVTIFSISAIFVVLRMAQTLLMAVVDEERHAPKLLFDLVRIGLAIAGGALVVSNVWHVDLGSLLAAMGVGSIVLGFALQDVAGNFVSGLGLLYQNKFAIGDWIVVEGKVAQVMELDWRSVTLLAASGEQIIAANSSLAKSNVTIAARSGEQRWAEVPFELGFDIPPERVRAAVLETGSMMEDVLGADGVRCMVAGYSSSGVRYSVLLHVANPSILAGPRNEFLSRFWYVAQRHGVRLSMPDGSKLQDVPDMDEAAKRQVLAETRMFGDDKQLVATLARDATYQFYRSGEVLLLQNEPAVRAFVVVSGTLRAGVEGTSDQFWMERIDPHQMFIVQEMLDGVPSPVRVVAEGDAEVLTIPSAALPALVDPHRPSGRDLAAMVEARRRSVLALTRNLRVVV